MTSPNDHVRAVQLVIPSPVMGDEATGTSGNSRSPYAPNFLGRVSRLFDLLGLTSSIRRSAMQSSRYAVCLQARALKTRASKIE